MCSANLTRSPAAASLFQRLADGSGERWKVASAGARAATGSPPNPVIAYIMSQRGVPIQGHRSRPVTRRLLKRYRWVVVMEQAHRRELLELEPGLQGRLFLLRELAGGSAAGELDMPDPTGGEVEDYADLFAIFDEAIPKVFGALREKVYNLAHPGD